VLDDLTFTTVLNGICKHEAERLAMDMLGRVRMADKADSSTFTLSGGEKQRVALAGILLRNPSVLVLDEPTTGLDEKSRIFLGECISELTASGIAALVITHDAEFARKHCCVEIRMENGRLYA
jgi:polar amino acid transport system ATP-binding protein